MGDKAFARLIKKRRDTLGLSQARLGELVGRSASTIRNWERGASTPAERADAVALAAVLGLEESEVLTHAGFEAAEIEEHPTMDQAYASLAQYRVKSATADSEVEPPVTPATAAETEDEPEDPFEPEPSEETEAVEVRRAAPPTVLEAAGSGEPSYLEDPDERQKYRMRAIITAAIVVFLLIVLLWAFRRTTDSLGALWDDFFNSLEL